MVFGKYWFLGLSQVHGFVYFKITVDKLQCDYSAIIWHYEVILGRINRATKQMQWCDYFLIRGYI